MNKPQVTIIIPARFASSRYPGKPLALITGHNGSKKTLIERTYEAARSVENVANIYIATDDDRIASVAAGFGAETILTSPKCRNGTERCAEAVGQLRGKKPDIVINWQGDSLLTPPHYVENIIEFFEKTPTAVIATPAIKVEAGHYEKLVAAEKSGQVGGTSVVFSQSKKALYFSKMLIPFRPTGIDYVALPSPYLHIGVYGYRPDILMQYPLLTPSPLEAAEGLEQLRFLHHDIPVHIVEVAAPEWELWELNNPSDLEPIELALKKMQRP